MELLQRRSFLKKTGLLGAGLLLNKFPVWGQSLFAYDYPQHNITAEKNLDKAWVDSLFKRTAPTVYRKTKNELNYIGMPIGGLHAGTVYVGGDGRLWLWQIYNQSFEGVHEGIDPKLAYWNDGNQLRKIRPRDGSAYVEPALANNLRVLEQGFAIKLAIGDKTIIKELKADDWDEVSFSGSYPVANVQYSSNDLPIGVKLKAYSPFIPLDADNSALPATIIRITIANNSGTEISPGVIGWLENGASKLNARAGKGQRKNVVNADSKSAQIISSFDFTDPAMATLEDYGTMCFACLENNARANPALDIWPIKASAFEQQGALEAVAIAPDKLVGAINTHKTIAPNSEQQFDFIISWHFNNPNTRLKKIVKDANEGYHFGKRFADAQAVSSYVIKNFETLTTETEQWEAVWHNSTLPHWFLERSILNVGTLATANTYKFASDRFWAWEGVGACAGTCTHVWQYAQAMARLFPSLERGLRQNTDLGIGFKEDTGAIIFRGENETRPAIDGQAGTILRFYREHLNSVDDSFLQLNWPKIKKAVKFMLSQDKNGDGMTDTPMENTLDAVWEGEIAWIVGLCIAAARAAQAMALEVGDKEFEAVCKKYVSKGKANMEAKLFNGEYFIHKPDPTQGRKKLGSYNTCHIDQVYGQSWTFQVGLPRVLDQQKTISALQSLWKYNFTPNVGPYIKTHIGGRPYAIDGEGGMVMTTNPLNEKAPFGDNVTWQLGYFHECMSGFEHQVAAHMMAEGMLEESMVLTHAIHQRYHAAKRNPFNEIECSDHYARAMASYGTFLNACGFYHHGPKGIVGFAPKWDKQNFSTPFTTAEGWGTYTQTGKAGAQSHIFDLRYGKLMLTQLNLENFADLPSSSKITAKLAGNNIKVKLKQADNKEFMVSFANKILVEKNQKLEITIA